MGRVKKTQKLRKVIAIKKKTSATLGKDLEDNKVKKKENIHIDETPASLFFQANLRLGPPYFILLDTNFINFSIQHKIDLFKGLMDLFLAKCIPCVTDCVIAELEKMGHRYRLALRLAKDPRVKRLTCTHKGTYADDCIVNRVSDHRCYIVGTSDKDLKNRIRKITGVPIVFVAKHKYVLERLPDVAL